MNHVLIVPVHPPKLINLIQFLYSCDQPHTQTPIMLVCTTDAESQEIGAVIQASGATKHLKLSMQIAQTWSQSCLGTEATEYLLQNSNNCVVNFKKFAALHMALTQSYQMAVVIDADALCMGSLDAFMAQARRNYLKAEWWGCAVDDASIGIGACTLSTQVLGPEVQAWSKSNQIMNIYNWFLDPPTYNLMDVKNFFDHMAQLHGGLNMFFQKTSWFTFDFLVFSQWLAYQNRAKILDYSSLMGVNHVPEILSVAQLQQLQHRWGVSPAWCSTAAVLKEPDHLRLKLPNCHMMYHVDRPHVL